MNGKNHPGGVSDMSDAGTVPPLRPVSDPVVHAAIELAKGFWEKSPALSWVTDEAGRLCHFSETCPGRFGLAAAQGGGWAEAGMRPADIAQRFSGHGHTAIAARHPTQTLERLPGADGTLHDFLVIRFPFDGSDGTRYLGCVAIDITRHRQRVDELAQLAVIDELTGLYNRRGFFLFAEHELKAAGRRKTHSALIYADIDGLKAVNDRCGHGEGNLLLMEMATFLRQEFRGSDVIARLGGDEFAVFASEVKGDPVDLKKRVCAHLHNFTQVTCYPGRLSVSIGLSSCGPGDGVTLAELVAAADHAMYKDKYGKDGRTDGASEDATRARIR